MSRGEFLALLESSDAFGDFWCHALAGLSLQAYCWECPALQTQTLGQPFECVFVESPLLSRTSPDPAPFAAYFRADQDVVVFPSLGGDAVLVVPCPCDAQDFGHLAHFMRHARPTQIRALWRQVGASARVAASKGVAWLSTAGLGVSWLHVRLDSRPKYYRYVPYRQVAGGDGG